MYFGQFTKALNKSLGVNLVESIRSYGHLIQKTADNKILIDNNETEFETLEEARSHIIEKNYSDNLEEEITKELYEDMTAARIANIIKEYHDIKVTDTLIESYIDLASSKIFTIDPVVQQIRALNKLDKIVEGKLHYELNDGSVIAINENTKRTLNNLLQGQQEIIEYMRESSNNFLHVLEQIEE